VALRSRQSGGTNDQRRKRFQAVRQARLAPWVLPIGVDPLILTWRVWADRQVGGSKQSSACAVGASRDDRPFRSSHRVRSVLCPLESQRSLPNTSSAHETTGKPPLLAARATKLDIVTPRRELLPIRRPSAPSVNLPKIREVKMFQELRNLG
jgi:hypothetical protein